MQNFGMFVLKHDSEQWIHNQICGVDKLAQTSMKLSIKKYIYDLLYVLFWVYFPLSADKLGYPERVWHMFLWTVGKV